MTERLTITDRAHVRQAIDGLGDYVETLREQSRDIRAASNFGEHIERLSLEHKAQALERTAAELNAMLYRIPLSADERQESER